MTISSLSLMETDVSKSEGKSPSEEGSQKLKRYKMDSKDTVKGLHRLQLAKCFNVAWCEVGGLVLEIPRPSLRGSRSSLLSLHR